MERRPAQIGREQVRGAGHHNRFEKAAAAEIDAQILRLQHQVSRYRIFGAAASRIPRAGLVALESRNHVLLLRDPAWAAFVSAVRRFLREEGTPTASRASSTGGSAGRAL
jgi:hypothetical protein